MNYYIPDSHTPSFGTWTVGQAHLDPPGHTCGAEWERGEAVARLSFYDLAGNELPFVGAVYTAYEGYEGYYGCPFQYYDGYDTFIELLY